MNILVLDNKKEDEKSKTKSKNVICPECGEIARIKIQNY